MPPGAVGTDGQGRPIYPSGTDTTGSSGTGRHPVSGIIDVNGNGDGNGRPIYPGGSSQQRLPGNDTRIVLCI